jgi:alginate O-acetyltransferase complex protein AlgI
MSQSPLFLNIELIFGLSCWVILIYLARSTWLKKNIVLFGSIIFYLYFAGINQFFVIVFLSLSTYFIGKTKNRKLIIVGILLNLGGILFSKWVVSQETTTNLAARIWIPLGISFFVFEFIHYLIEIRRGAQPEESLSNFLTFSFFFPTVVSGPIRRYQSFTSNLQQLKRPSRFDVETGLLHVAVGYIYKFLGDYCAILQERSYNQGDFVGFDDGRFVLLGASLRIFLDFAGYSYIAIGFARLIGIYLPPNFNAPYLSTSIIDFWNRWHISLSSWVRDYLYIPLGGSRVAFSRQAANLLISMVVIGLWHGLGLKFAVWGGLQGVALVVNHSFRRLRQNTHSVPSLSTALPPKIRRDLERKSKNLNQNRTFFNQIASIFSWFLTFSFVSISWLFFFYSPSEAWRIFYAIFLQGALN